MNILILTGKFGMGHLSAANALREQLGQDGHRAEVVDLFEYAAPELAPAMYWWFNVLVTYGGVFYNFYHDLTVNDSGDSRGTTCWAGWIGCWTSMSRMWWCPPIPSAPPPWRSTRRRARRTSPWSPA